MPLDLSNLSEDQILTALKQVGDIKRLLVDIRCRKCRRLFFRWLPVGKLNFEVKCSRCGHTDFRLHVGIIPTSIVDIQNDCFSHSKDVEQTKKSEITINDEHRLVPLNKHKF
jgi:phage FluMu protein Com